MDEKSEEPVQSVPSYKSVLEGLEESDDRDNFGLQVGEMLYGSHMHDYIPVFREQNIGLDLFLSLNEDDLAVLGVNEKDIPIMAKLIRNRRPISTSPDTSAVKNHHLLAEPEPKMSMKNLLLMQCHTAKQLKLINGMLDDIELKLRGNKFENTLLDTDYCAAHALKIICTELARQADILSAESKNLNDHLLKMTNKTSEKCVKKRSSGGIALAGVIIASVTPLALVLWRTLRK